MGADIIVVCTANVARSPLLSARIGHEVKHRLAADAILTASAGTDARFGTAAASGSVVVAQRWGLSLAEHSATPIAYIDFTDPALVITMERGHRREITDREPAAAARTFTWAELVLILTERVPADELAALPSAIDRDAARTRLEAAVALADTYRPRRLSRKRAEVPDPIGAGQAMFDELGERFAREAEAVADVLFGPLPAHRRGCN